MKKIIHMEFNMDDDVEEQPKNANDGKAEGKVRVKKKQYTIMTLVAKTRAESKLTRKKLRKPKMTMKNQGKMMKMIRLLSPRK